ncbi:UDP-2,4-diacetamido-2,4,6-trideoxy-beta-L-altropyranose hydrolase [Psychromonas algicola]|uniref:UDP-2,4-diacetamido-2,4, 6-trideoxy-beta-L-altropyranose hydrolase n=1 Tax=Psychromonas algicola TaxID=2555642 RepID=UPI001068478C|nr:UDP-2,4-diacetamido-2,4,6-trideoxy-beta-L-altropyranose hydrolase [Psychromonas sp. RZ5]TEW51612.1 UDP-2,4-diacetamido-2,4,6-trideoxy-beta-L-altropyranose hydrolase [Psychromonas sp. RZ5]
MNIVIRTDSSLHIGSGHIMRCLVLAEKLKAQGHQVSFASRSQQGDLIEFVEKKGFHVYLLNKPKQWKKPKNSSDYAAWLQVSWQDDAQSFIQQIEDVDLIIVDHYGINAQWEGFIKSHFSCQIFVIDDLVRQHQAEIILDQTLARTSQEYKKLNPNSLVLTGSDFALITPKFVELRNKILQSKINTTPPTVLLSMGGVDQPNATLKVLEALSKLKNKPKVTVLLSPRAPHYKLVSEYYQQHIDWIQHINFVEDMAELMSKHSFAIGAPGTTSWERACLGIPSIIIPLADNQKTTCEQLTKAGAAIKVELAEIKTLLVVAYQTMHEQWQSMHLKNLAICDGLGLQRVVHSINDFETKKNNAVILRAANNSDIKQVYDWQLLPQTRQYALIKSIPTWCEHQQWMKAKLEDKAHFFYMIKSLLTEADIGVLRLDKQSDENKANRYTLSIFLDPLYMGKGFAKEALNYIDTLHPRLSIEAKVLEENKASQALFSSANYTRVSPTLFIRQPSID